MSFEDTLGSAMRSSVETLDPPVQRLAAGGLARGVRRRRRQRTLTAVATGVAVLAVAGGATAVVRGGTDTSTVTPATGGPCNGTPDDGVLPTWARDGFSDPEPRIAHVLSDHGSLVAILFAPLQAPSAPGRNNKVLWAATPEVMDAGPLKVAAVHEGSTDVVHRTLDGIGPSTLDLPAPGCWQLTLRWGADRHVDHLDLEYARP